MARKKIREYDSKRLLKENFKRLSGYELPIKSAQVSAFSDFVWLITEVESESLIRSKTGPFLFLETWESRCWCWILNLCFSSNWLISLYSMDLITFFIKNWASGDIMRLMAYTRLLTWLNSETASINWDWCIIVSLWPSKTKSVLSNQ